jgi:inhibitor of KinA
MGPFRIHSAGDAAVVVGLPEAIDPEVNAWCVALSRTLTTNLGTIARDVVIGYCSVTVFFDPIAVDAQWLEAEIAECAATTDVSTVIGGGTVEVPVCYGGDEGPDLADVAAFARCSQAEAITLHASREYRVYLVGFVPGFAYMAEVDPRIAAPRRSSPRTSVPAGSVAIAGGQTGVYPSVTPGGWNIIGRTPLKPFDAARAEPFLLKPGDRVRFLRLDDRECGRA